MADEINLDSVKGFFESNKDNEDVKAFVGGLNPVTVDKVKSLVNDNPDFKSWFDSEKDTHAEKYNNTWKKNNLQKLIDEAVAKANPQETSEQKQIRELTERLNQKEAAEKHSSLVNRAMKEMTDKKLPVDLVDYFVGEDENKTSENIKKFEKILNAHDEQIKLEFAKGNSHIPPNNNKSSGLGELDKLKKQIHDKLNK